MHGPMSARARSAARRPLHEPEVADVGTKPSADQAERRLDVASEPTEVMMRFDRRERESHVWCLDLGIQTHDHRVLDRRQVRAVPTPIRRAAPHWEQAPPESCHISDFVGRSQPHGAPSSDFSPVMTRAPAAPAPSSPGPSAGLSWPTAPRHSGESFSASPAATGARFFVPGALRCSGCPRERGPVRRWLCPLSARRLSPICLRNSDRRRQTPATGCRRLSPRFASIAGECPAVAAYYGAWRRNRRLAGGGCRRRDSNPRHADYDSD